MATIDIGKLSFTHKGDYAGGTAYVLNDVVYYNGSAYIAKHQQLVMFQQVQLTGIVFCWFRRNMECFIIRNCWSSSKIVILVQLLWNLLKIKLSELLKLTPTILMVQTSSSYSYWLVLDDSTYEELLSKHVGGTTSKTANFLILQSVYRCITYGSTKQ